QDRAPYIEFAGAQRGRFDRGCWVGKEEPRGAECTDVCGFEANRLEWLDRLVWTGSLRKSGCRRSARMAGDQWDRWICVWHDRGLHDPALPRVVDCRLTAPGWPDPAGRRS